MLFRSTAGNTGDENYVNVTSAKFDLCVFGNNSGDYRFGLRPQLFKQNLNEGTTSLISLPDNGMPVSTFLMCQDPDKNLADYFANGFQVLFDGEIIVNNTNGTTVEELGALIGEQVYRCSGQLAAALGGGIPAGYSYASSLGAPANSARLYRQQIGRAHV